MDEVVAVVAGGVVAELEAGGTVEVIAVEIRNAVVIEAVVTARRVDIDKLDNGDADDVEVRAVIQHPRGGRQRGQCYAFDPHVVAGPYGAGADEPPGGPVNRNTAGFGKFRVEALSLG